MTLDRVIHIDDITERRWTFAEYKAIEAVNWSTLKWMRKSPLHFRNAEEGNDETDSDALRLGRVGHIAVFEPERLVRDTAVWTGARRAGKDWDAFEEKHADKTIITIDQAQRAIGMRDAVRGCPLVMPYLATGAPEQVIQWKDRKTGVACKARLDWSNDAALLDLKSAKNAVDMRAFSADAFRLGYFHQLAFYQRGLAVVRGMGEGPPAFIVAVEPELPHDVAVYRLSEDALHFVGQHIDQLLAKVVECRVSGIWPGTFNAEQLLDMPKWGYPSVEDMVVPDVDWLRGA